MRSTKQASLLHQQVGTKVRDNYDIDAVRDSEGRVLEGVDKHLRVLERRSAFLYQRLERGKREGKTLTHDEHEKAAIDWAIDELNERFGK